jgi:hypothetical protein
MISRLAYCRKFMVNKFTAGSGRLRLNFVTVDDSGVKETVAFVSVEDVDKHFGKIKQTPGANKPPRLGEALEAGVALSEKLVVPGSHQIVIVISADGRSRYAIVSLFRCCNYFKLSYLREQWWREVGF